MNNHFFVLRSCFAALLLNFALCSLLRNVSLRSAMPFSRFILSLFYYCICNLNASIAKLTELGTVVRVLVIEEDCLISSFNLFKNFSFWSLAYHKLPLTLLMLFAFNSWICDFFHVVHPVS